MRVLLLALAVLLTTPLSATAHAESTSLQTEGVPTDLPPTLPLGDDPKGGGGMG